MRTNTIVVLALRASVPLWNSVNVSARFGRIGSARTWRRGTAPPSAVAAFLHVVELDAVLRRPIERRLARPLRPRSECRSVCGTP